MIGESRTSATLQRALDGVWQRQKAIANNIANYETPGYKAMKVAFEDSLHREISKSNRAGTQNQYRSIHQIRNAAIQVEADESTAERLDGNNVNLEIENIEMAKSQLQYQYLTRGMSDMFSRLRYAISEGKK